MRKSIIAIAILCASTMLLFQNCGKDQTAVDPGNTQLNGGDSGGVTTNGGNSGGTNNGGTTGGTNGTTNGGTTGTTTGSTNGGGTGEVQITKGLANATVFGSPNGVTVSITLKKTTDITYAWVIAGKTVNTTVPKVTFTQKGKVSISVTAKHKNGDTAKSSATLNVSRYMIVGGVLKYDFAGDGKTLLDVKNVDIKTVKPIGLFHAADKNGFYTSTYFIKNASATSAVELNANYIKVGTAVYFFETPTTSTVSGIDAASAANVSVNSDNYVKDKNAVFCGKTKVANSDPKTALVPFKPIENFFKDGGNLYGGCAHLMAYKSYTEVKPAADTQTYRFLRIDGSYYYLGGSSAYKTKPKLEKIPFNPADPTKLKYYSVAGIAYVSDGVKTATFTSTGLVLSPINFDAGSLVKVSNYFYKDKNFVYFINDVLGWGTVPDAKPASFKMLGNQSLYTDGTRVWISYYNKGYNEVTKLDIPSLRSVSFSIFADKKAAYIIQYKNNTVYAAKVTVSVPSELAQVPDSYYLKDSKRLYYSNGSVYAIPGVVPGTTAIKVFKVGLVGVGKVLVGGTMVIPNVDASKLKAIYLDYHSDGKYVVYTVGIGGAVISSKASTFKVFDEKISRSYCTDGTTVWYGSLVVKEAHIPTFKVLTLTTAEDKAYKYVGNGAHAK